MDPEEEGRRAFMDKLPLDACPYEEDLYAASKWKLGYHKQEYDELKLEQLNLLSSYGYLNEPHTQLDEFIHELRQEINRISTALSR